MQHSALAQQFEDVSRGLRADGHGIIMRKARELLESGDTEAAMAFIERAGSRMPGDALDGLLTAVRSWAAEGGDVKALIAEPTWTASRAREDHGAKLIGEAVAAGEGLSDMVDSLALEQMALNEKEALASLPPMPERVAVDAPVEPDAPAEPVEPETPVEAPSAAIEKPADLESRRPDFDEPAEPETPAEPDVAAEPEAPAEPETPAEPDAAAEPDVAAEPETPAEPDTPAEPEAAADADFGKDEPAEPPVEAGPSTPAPQEAGGGGGLALMIVVLGGLIAAAWYFLR